MNCLSTESVRNEMRTFCFTDDKTFRRERMNEERGREKDKESENDREKNPEKKKRRKDNSRMYQKYPTKKLLRECILSLG